MLKFILVIHGLILIYVYGKPPSWIEASSIVLSSETVKRFFLMAAKLSSCCISSMRDSQCEHHDAQNIKMFSSLGFSLSK